MNTHEPTHDYPDALIDRSLAELLGGETPPDLSEKILAAANALHSEPITLAQGAAAMNTKPKSGMSWKVLAATILVGGTTVFLLLPDVKVARESARTDGSLARVEQETLERKEQSGMPRLQKPESKLGLEGRVVDDTSGESGKKLKMMVTPHIIIAKGEEEERLGIAAEEVSGEAKPAPALTPYAVPQNKSVPNVGTVISRGVKPESWGMGQGGEQASAPVVYPDAGQWEKLAARKKKYGAVDLSGRSGILSSELEAGDKFGQRFRIDAAPGSKVDRYLSEQREPLGWKRTADTSRDQYTPIHENPFITAAGPDAVSTFSIDVDTASYANVRQFLQQSRQLPPPDAVRIEELVNYFDYDYTGPTDDTPFAANMEIAGCPWNNEHRLARIAIKGRDIDRQARPQSNLVFLIDVSGSMDEPNKLPLLVEGMKLLTRELGENDKVAIVVYASSEGLALTSTRGNEQQTILAALDQLRAGGSTAGGAGINLAYQIATDNFIEGGTNRVILCTDGDFNVGVTSTADLERLAEVKAKTGVFLTVLGFGRGNLNDAMMEAISGKGNGNYHYVDNLTEARKVLVEEMVGTLITIAKDVKIQVEFNPAKVAGYRLIGYENRMLKTEDFNNDKKDAGEIGAGHTVTALYEIIPVGKEVAAPSVDPLKYQQPLSPPPRYPGEGLGEGSSEPREYGGEYGGRGGYGGGYGEPTKPPAASDELLTLKLRYKLPDADKSTKLEFPITDKGGTFAEATEDFQFAAAVASFGMLLRHSEHKGDTSYDAVQEIAQSSLENDPHGYRAEFLELVRLAKQLTGEQPSSAAEPSITEGP